MHDTAFRYGQIFYNAYISKTQNVQIIEIGSQNVNGGLRDIFQTPYTHFVGLDFIEGPGVDRVLDDPYRLPYDINTVDVLLCSSVLEHCEMFWVMFLEMVRVVKPGGLIYINVPSNGDFHRWPVDCWRFYPDSGKALEKWARHNGHDIVMMESFVGNQDQDIWNDFVVVFCKGTEYIDRYNDRILHNITDYTNGRLYGNDDFLNYDPIPQDRKTQ
jgi:predicted SAM-dependent methyltransferase